MKEKHSKKILSTEVKRCTICFRVGHLKDNCLQNSSEENTDTMNYEKN